MTLHLYFRNTDGSLTWSAWFVLTGISLVWFLWALGVFLAPGWVLTRVGLPSDWRAMTALRAIGLVAGAIALIVAALIVASKPGKLY